MKKITMFLMLMLTSVSLLILGGCKKNNKIVVAEVTHSVFYAPQYVALSEGFYEEEGLDIEIILASGADKVMASLISKEADIGLMGPEASIYVYAQGKKDYAITFAQLTQRDGTFIFGREKILDFTLEDLKGHSILGGRKGGMPEMTLEYILKSKGIEIGQNDPTKEVNIRTDVAFAAMAGAFIAGEGDFTTLFEPTASEMELNGNGYILMSVGEETVDVAYTTYQALKSYIDNNEEVVIKFTNAILKAVQWTYNTDSMIVAESIHSYFKETDINILAKSIERYKSIGAWSNTPYLSEDEFIVLQDIVIAAGELDRYMPYNILVQNKYNSKR